jgi:hypothetical protein
MGVREKPIRKTSFTHRGSSLQNAQTGCCCHATRCVHVLSFDVSPTSSSDQSTSSLSFISFPRFSATQRQESTRTANVPIMVVYPFVLPQASPSTLESTLNDVADQSDAHNQVKVKVFRGLVEVIITLSLSLSPSLSVSFVQWRHVSLLYHPPQTLLTCHHDSQAALARSLYDDAHHEVYISLSRFTPRSLHHPAVC